MLDGQGSTLGSGSTPNVPLRHEATLQYIFLKRLVEMRGVLLYT